MSAIDPEILRAHLRRLDADTCTALVADLWAARGFDTSREEALVVATRGTERVTIRVDCGGRLPGRRRAASTRDVDVVVAPDAGRRVRRRAAEAGARVVDAATLGEMLSYAVDRSVAADLCAKHLGAPPSELRPPLRVRAGDRLRAVEPALGPTALVAVVVLVVVASVTVPGIGLVGNGESVTGALGESTAGTGVAETPTTTATTTNEPTTDAGDARSGPFAGAASIPGMSPDGVENLTALAAAHDAALGEQNYTLWIDTYGPQNGTPNGTRVQRDIDIAVEGDRYVLEEELEIEGDRTPVRTIYHDGTEWYVAEYDGDNTTYRLVDVGGDVRDIGPRPGVIRKTFVQQFLSTPDTRITGRIGRGESARYRVVGRGRPAAATSPAVYNYTIVAVVDSDGLVRDARISYTVGHTSRQYTVRTELTYGRIGSTTVEPQPWFERRVESNGSVTGASGA